MRQLQTEQMRISMSPSMSKRVEVEGKIIKHRALFAGTFFYMQHAANSGFPECNLAGMPILNMSHVLFAETFSSTLTSEEENAGMGGIAMLTLSDTENNLHFILIHQGLIKHKEEGEISKCRKEQMG